MTLEKIRAPDPICESTKYRYGRRASQFASGKRILGLLIRADCLARVALVVYQWQVY